MSDLYSKLLNVPYKKNGRDFTGLDCLGLVLLVNKDKGIDMPDYVTPDKDSFIYQMFMGIKPRLEKLGQPEADCILVFKMRHYYFHIGIILEDCETFLHILENRNVCKEKLNHIAWRNRIEGFYRWK